MHKLLEEESQIRERIEGPSTELEKVIIGVGKMIREDFLQQNVFSSFDRYFLLNTQQADSAHSTRLFG